MEYEGEEYWYIHNAQNDVIGLIDKTGELVVEYTYDTWGRPVNVTGSLADTVGKASPFRYRGYVFDEETGLYYLQSRYYNPEWGRFINADGTIGANGDITSNNLFAYCSNNPVNYSDPTGESTFQDDYMREHQGVYTVWNDNLGRYVNSFTPPAPKVFTSNYVPRKDKRKGSENRQPTGQRERNQGHPNEQEHSRIPKGNPQKGQNKNTPPPPQEVPEFRSVFF